MNRNIKGIMVTSMLLFASVCCANDFVDTYESTCVKFYGNPNGLRNYFFINRFIRLPKDASNGLLNGEVGAVWLIRGNADIMVALREDGICTVYGKKIDVSETKKKLEIILNSPPTPFNSVKMSESSSTFLNGTKETLVYSWEIKDKKDIILFTFMGNTSKMVGMQGVASAALARKN